MGHTLKKPLIVCAVLVALGSAPAFATNGLAPTGLGQTHKAMGGAAAGYAVNTTSMATNPASAAFVKDGYDVGVELFMPNRSATAGGSEHDGNGEPVFYVPEFGYKRKVNNKVDAGVVVYGNGGMNTEYNNATTMGFGGSKVGVDYQQLFVSPTISYKVNERNAIGASANLVYHKFKVDGASNFDNPMFSASPGKVTDNGYDSSTGAGVSVGWQGQVNDKVSVGAAYRSKVKMGKLGEYKGLLANGGEFDVPAAATIGMAYKVTPKTTVAADIQRIQYSDVAAIGNSSTKLMAGKPMGSANGPGFGWDDQTIYKIGIRHQKTDNIALMAGYNHGKTPLNGADTTLGVLAPATVEDHLALGVEARLSPKSKLTASYVHAFNKEVKGNATGMLDRYNLKMDQDAVGISYSREF